MRSAGNCESKVRSCTRLASESDDYFASRPWRSRLAAIASEQSAPIASRHALLERLRETAERHGTPDPVVAPEDDAGTGAPPAAARATGAATACGRPSSNSGVEGEHRLHDRARWTRVIAPVGDGRFQAEPWRHERLQP